MSDRLKPTQKLSGQRKSRGDFLRASFMVGAAATATLIDGSSVNLQQLMGGVAKAAELYTQRVSSVTQEQNNAAVSVKGIVCPEVAPAAPVATPAIKIPEQQLACPSPEQLAGMDHFVGIALGGFLFENPDGNKINTQLQPDSILRAPIPNRTFLLTIFDDAGYTRPVFQRKLVVMPDGNGWGINPETGQPYERDEETGLYFVKYVRTGPGEVRGRGFNKLTKKFEDDMALAPYEVKRLTSKGEVALMDLGGPCGCKVEQIYRDSAAYCWDKKSIKGTAIDEFTLNRRLDLYPVNDWTPAKDGQLVRPNPRFLAERMPVK